MIHEATIIQQKCKRWLLFFTSSWFIVWTILPILLLKNTYIDILENLVWSRHLQFGYDKNPPLGALLTRLGYYLSGNHIWSAYILSQISVIICFWAIWRLGRKILPHSYALLAVLFLFGIQFYGQNSIEFNDDVIELSLWALTCLYFYNATKQQKLLYWILTGIFAGLCFMDKYYCLTLFLAMLTFLLINQQARTAWRTTGPYIAAGIFAITILPNIIWLSQHNFVAITYALNRAEINPATITNFSHHITSPIYYLFNMARIVLPSLCIFFICFWQKRSGRLIINKFDQQFISILCFGPFIITLMFSVITGGNIKISWTTPIFSMLGIFTFMTWQPQLTRINIRRYAILTIIMFIIWIFSYCWNLLIRPKSSYETFPGKAVAATFTKIWHDKYKLPIKYVAASRKLACNLAIYSPDKPTAYFSWNSALNPWINEKKINKFGAIFLWQSNGMNIKLPNDIAKRFPTAKIQGRYNFNIAVHDWIKKIKKSVKIPQVEIDVAFLPPKI